jgi:hypothetical protein
VGSSDLLHVPLFFKKYLRKAKGKPDFSKILESRQVKNIVIRSQTARNTGLSLPPLRSMQNSAAPPPQNRQTHGTMSSLQASVLGTGIFLTAFCLTQSKDHPDPIFEFFSLSFV